MNTPVSKPGTHGSCRYTRLDRYPVSRTLEVVNNSQTVRGRCVSKSCIYLVSHCPSSTVCSGQSCIQNNWQCIQTNWQCICQYLRILTVVHLWVSKQLEMYQRMLTVVYLSVPKQLEMYLDGFSSSIRYRGLCCHETHVGGHRRARSCAFESGFVRQHFCVLHLLQADIQPACRLYGSVGGAL